ncbi:uncharacterized protein LOC120083669 [Benincasa hispida]|uniref:uncharacterized protein LOC120083669 n=1 Tax=Benincasa hispida TaxID=102211 RepID=UPI0019026249|nr:uncharacterized protein LOC120083669 [Benincasa hispida]
MEMMTVAYEARMAHIQFLLHLDEYEKALRFLEEERNFPRCEGRLYLYQAVVHTMLDKDDNAEKWWNKYLETLGNGNVNENLKMIDCTNTNSESSLKGAKDLLKPLLSLKPAKEEKNSVLSNIIPIKNMAFEEVVNGEYDLAECLMKCSKLTLLETQRRHWRHK